MEDLLEINCRIHGQNGQYYLNKDELNSCFVATNTEFTRASSRSVGRAFPGSVAQFDSHPTTIIKTRTVLDTSDDTVLSNPIEHYNLRLTMPGAATDVIVASHADFTWNANLPLFIDYI